MARVCLCLLLQQGSAGSQRSIRSRDGGGRGGGPLQGAAPADPQATVEELLPCAIDSVADAPQSSTEGAALGARAALEQLYWVKFLRLRDWARQGIPARGAIH